MNKLFRFFDLCRESVARHNGQTMKGLAYRSAENNSRRRLAGTLLRIEGLEERQLLAVSAGSEIPEYVSELQETELSAVDTHSAIAEISAGARVIGSWDAENSANLANNYSVVADNIDTINSYFADANAQTTVTKDYAVFFLGGVNSSNNHYRYYASVVDLYAVLTTEMNVAAENIYILYADGTDPAVDRSDYQNSDMTFAADNGTTVLAATLENLSGVMDSLSVTMDDSSHLLFFCYDHGAGITPNDDPENYKTDFNDYLCDWIGSKTEYSFVKGEEVAEQVFKIQNGYVTCVFSECFSGGVLDDIYNVSSGTLNEAYTGNAHFFGMAATNHYEESWTAEYLEGGFAGFAQSFILSISSEGGGILNTADSFAYTFSSSPFSAKTEEYSPNEGIYTNQQEHPWAMGESFDIFGFNTAKYQFVVTTLEDVVDSDDGELSLREAVETANSLSLTGISCEITFADNLAGGTIRLTDGQLEITRSVTIDASSLGVKGITIDAAENSRVFYVIYGEEDAPVILNNLTITGGSENLGAGIYNAGILEIRNCNIVQNTALQDGGGIYSTGRLVMTNSSVKENNASGNYGGGIYSLGTLTVANSEFVNNVAEGTGGAIANRNGELSLSSVVIDGNTAKDGAALANFYGSVSFGVAGGEDSLGQNKITNNESKTGATLYNVGSVFTLTHADVSGNFVENGDGGVLLSIKDGAVVISDSTLVRNSAVNAGAVSVSGGTLSIINTEITRNNASGIGGGLVIEGTKTAELVNVTIAGNTALSGAGIYAYSDFSAVNTIVALNDGGDIVLNGAAASANAVISTFADWSTGSKYQIYDGKSPLFADPGNGIYSLASNSSALDAGVNSLACYVDGEIIKTDVIGNTRFSNIRIDLGAYEYQQQTVASLCVTTDQDVIDEYDGYISLREAVLYTALYGDTLGTTITFASDMAGKTIYLDAALGAIEITSSLSIDASDLFDTANNIPGITVDAGASKDDLRRVFEILPTTAGAAVVLNGITVTGGFLESEAVEANGAGIYARNVDLTLVNSLVTSNTVYGRNASGAGIYLNQGTLTLKGTVISGNAVSGFYTYGGGIYVAGKYVIEDSRFVKNISYASGSENDSYAYGGGLYAAAGSTGYVANSEFSANVAGYNSIEEDDEFSSNGTFYAYGGGLYLLSEKVTMVNVTAAGNAASAAVTGFGGGVFFGNSAGEYTVSNSIILSNYASVYGNDIYHNTIDFSHAAQSLISNYTLSTFENWGTDSYYVYDEAFSLFKVNPRFENGILSNIDTYDLAMTQGSQAINKGENTLLVYADGETIEKDLAGNSRVYANIKVDLGAYEFQSDFSENRTLVVTILEDIVDKTDGEISLREAVEYAKYASNDAVITFDPSLANGTILYDADLGEIVISASVTVDASSLSEDEESHKTMITLNSAGLSRLFSIEKSAASVTMKGLAMVGGTASGGGTVAGGAIYAQNRTLSLIDCTIQGASVSGDIAMGGAIYSLGDLKMEYVEITGSKTVGATKAYGGAICSNASVSLTASTVSGSSLIGRSQEIYGGGIYAVGDVKLDDKSAVQQNSITISEFVVSLNANTSVIAVGTVLTASAYPAAEGDISYTWYRGTNPNDMAVISGAADFAYTVTEEDSGCYIKVVAVSSASGNTAQTMTSVPVFGLTLSDTNPGVGVTVEAKLLPGSATASWQWYRVADSGEETLIDGASKSSYTVTKADIGFSLKVTAEGTGDYTGYALSAETEEVSVFDVVLSNTKPQVGETITASIDPASASVIWQWYRVSASGKARAIEGAVNSSYTVTESDAGYQLKVTATGINEYKGYTVSASTDSAVLYAELSNAEPILGETLTVKLTPSKAQALYLWYRGTDLTSMVSTGQMGMCYTVTEADRNCYIKVVVIGSGEYTGWMTSAATSTRIADFSLSLDCQNPMIGDTVTASLSPADADVVYQWYRIGANGRQTLIEGAVLQSYQVTVADAGSALKVTASGINASAGQSAFAVTNAVESVEASLSNPEPYCGDTLTVSWVPERMSADVQWYRTDMVGGRTKIEGATGLEYTVSKEDIGFYIVAEITGTDDFAGKVLSVSTSNAVQQKELSVTITPDVPTVGTELTAQLSSDVSVSWQWYRVNGASETVITGAKKGTYTVTASDIGFQLKVKAVGTGDYTGLSAEAVTSQAVAVLAVSISNSAPKEGETISAILAPEGAAAFYQWFRGTDPNNMFFISGASGADYQVTSEDVGCYLRVVAMGTEGYTGSFAMGTTAAVVTAAEPEPLESGAEPESTGDIVFPQIFGWGGGIYSCGSVTLDHASVVSENSISGATNVYGAGIYSKGTVRVAAESEVSSNTGIALVLGYGGGINAKNVELAKGTVAGNALSITYTDGLIGEEYYVGDEQQLYGGGIYASSSVTLTKGNVSSNSLTVVYKVQEDYAGFSGKVYGGGIYSEIEAIVEKNSVISSNTASITGHNDCDYGEAYGGGIWAQALTLTASTVSANTLTTTTTENYSAYGGGICVNSGKSRADRLMTMMDSTVSSNKILTGIYGYGGGIYIGSNIPLTITSENARPTSNANSVDHNDIQAYYNAIGGGIYAASSGTIRAVTVASNTTTTTDYAGTSMGAGVYVNGYGAKYVYSSKIIDNNAKGVVTKIGGIGFGGNGTVTMANTLVANNTAKEKAGVSLATNASLYNCTIAGNSSEGVSFSAMGSSFVYNSIILSNGTEVVNGEFAEAYYTLSTYTDWKNKPEEEGGEGEEDNPFVTSAEGPDDNGNLVYAEGDSVFLSQGTDPYSLASDSIAIDAGSDENYNKVIKGAGEYDVIGLPRFNGTIDMGAYEYADNADRVPDPKNIVVTTASDVVDASDGVISFREAVSYAADGATITFDYVNIGTVITLSSEFGAVTISKDLKIVSDPNHIITISGGYGIQISGDSNAVLDVTFSYVQVSSSSSDGIAGNYVNLTLEFDRLHKGNFSGNAERGINLAYSTLDAEWCDFTSNGGGIYTLASTVTISNAEITGNSAENGAGISLEYSTAKLESVKFTGNTVAGMGGALYVLASELKAANLEITGNRGESDGNVMGGGICLDLSTAEFDTITISGNTLVSYNGYVYGAGLCAAKSTIEMKYGKVNNNSGQASGIAFGGGFFLEDSVITMQYVDFACEKPNVARGEISVPGNSLSGHSAYGGAIAARGTEVTILDSLIEGNTATGASSAYGGALCVTGGNLSIYNTQISQNAAAFDSTGGSTSTYGGGIYYSSGDLTLVNCTVAFNSAMSADGCAYSFGGGIYAAPTGSSDPDAVLSVCNTIVAVNYALSGANIMRSDILETGENIDKGSNNIIDYNPYFAVSVEFNRYGQITNSEKVGLYATVTKESRAINTGNNDYAVYPDGTPIEASLSGTRIYKGDGYGVIDIGAHEYTGIPASVAHPSGVVTSLNDNIDPLDGVWTLREAIFYAVEDTVITFDAGLAGKTITLSDTLYIDKPLTIDFNGITLASGGSFRTLVAAEEATLSNVNIQGGTAVYGGGVYSSCLTLVNSNITGCSSTMCGGGIFTIGKLILSNCTITDCHADAGLSYGGAIYVEHTLTKYGVTKEGDTGILYIDGCLISNNSSGVLSHLWYPAAQGKSYAYGGALYISNATTVINKTRVEANYVTSHNYLYGGAIYLTPSAGKTVIANSYITGNKAELAVDVTYGVGGGIYTASTSELYLTNTVFSANTATDGGALYSFNRAKVNLLNCTIAGNTAVYGAGIYGFGTINLTNTVVALNKAVTAGDDIYKGPGSLNVYYKADYYAYSTLSSYSEWTNFAESDCNYYVYDSKEPLFAVDPVYNQSGKLVNADSLNLALTGDSQAVNRGVTETVDGENVVLYPDAAGNIFAEAGSPIKYAINGNEPCSAEVDRVLGDTVDLGAYEYHVQDSATLVSENGIIVTSLKDEIDYSDNDITLREAIALAGTKLENITIGTTITFDEKLKEEKDLNIELNTQLGTFLIDKSLTIDASVLGGELTISANGSEENLIRVFTIAGKSAAEVAKEAEVNGELTDEAVYQPFYLDVVLNGLTISGGYLDDRAERPAGAGIYAYYANLSIVNCTVKENTIVSKERDAVGGAALYAEFGKTCTINGSVITLNTVNASYVSGAAVSVNFFRTVDIADTKIESNSAYALVSASGSGLAVFGGTLTITNSLVALNTAKSGAESFGGGAYVTGTLTLTCDTIAGNSIYASSLSVGGGLYASGNLSVNNTILAGNNAGKAVNIEGTILDGKNNLIDADPNAVFFVPASFGSYGEILNQDKAEFDLCKDSIAIDAGDQTKALYADGSVIEYDVVGEQRVQGTALDIGAYEYCRIDLVVTTLKDTVDPNDGLLSLREAIALAGERTSGGEQYYNTAITFDSSLKGGTITLNSALGQLVIDKNLEIDASDLFDTETGQVGITVNAAGTADESLRVFSIVGEIGDDAIEVELTAIGITGGYLDGNLGNAYGGGIYAQNVELTLTDVAVTNNSAVSKAQAYGGGLYLSNAVLQVVRGTFSGNTVSGVRGAYGGGLYLAADAGNVTVRDAYLTGNTVSAVSRNAIAAGGAIYTNSEFAQLTVTNSQISGNSAMDGGAIASFAEASISLVNDTIAGNSATYGGGLFVFGNVYLANTILAMNSAAAEGTDLFRGSGNLGVAGNSNYAANYTISSYSGWDEGTGNLVYDLSKPLFAVSETGAYRLAEGSQAQGMGSISEAVYADGSVITLDIEGNPRISEDVIDMGAYQHTVDYGVSIYVTTLDDVVDANDGLISLREAVVWAAEQGASSRILFKSDLADGTILLRSELSVNSSVVIDAANLGITISANSQSRVFAIEGKDEEVISVTLAGLTITGGYLTAESASVFGAGIYSSSTNLTLNNCRITENRVINETGFSYLFAYGGGIYTTASCVLTITDSVISGNSATDGGGGIYSSGSMTIAGSEISSNSVNGSYSSGGGVYFSSGVFTMTGTSVAGNIAESEGFTKGGGLHLDGGTVRISNSSITGNKAFAGGGIYSFYNSSLVLTGTEVSDNIADGKETGNGFGGGIYSWGDMLTIEDSTISGNSCMGRKTQGAGLYMTYDLSVSITNSAILDNTAEGIDAFGGGAYVYYGIMTMTSVTVAGNTAESGAGFYIYGLSSSKQTSVAVRNTIFAENATSAGVSADVATNGKYVSISGDSVLSGTDLSAFVQNFYEYDPSKPLFNGASVGDYTLTAGSQGIDIGENDYAVYADASPIKYDLNGDDRIYASVIDLGAYEYQGTAVSDTPVQIEVTSYGANRHLVTWNTAKDGDTYLLTWWNNGGIIGEEVYSGTSAVVSGLTYGDEVNYSVEVISKSSSLLLRSTGASEAVSLVVCPMDINSDGDVAGSDRAMMARAWLSSEGDDNWDPRCDINGDGDVAGSDRSFLSANWLLEVGDDDMTYPKPLEAGTVTEAVFESADFMCEFENFG